MIVDGVDVHVRQDGSAGPAVVLLHGFSGSVHWFAAMAERLKVDHRVVRLDLRGFGETGGKSGFEPESQARLIAGVMDRLALDDVTVVGHSLGADYALALARSDGRVRRVVIIDQAPDYLGAHLPPTFIARGWMVSLLSRLPRRLLAKALKDAFAPGFSVSDAFDQPYRAVMDLRAMDPRMAREVRVNRENRLAAYPLDRQLIDAGLPALAIHGSEDQMYDCGSTLARYRAVGARTEIVAKSGHSPNVEKPDEVTDLIASFVRTPTDTEVAARDQTGRA